MPSRWPALTRRVAVSSAACAALPPERSIGNWPTPVKNHFLSRPLKPGSVKYSDLAGKVTLRLTRSGMKNESATARWLPARIAPPVSGMFSAPTTLVGHSVLSSGPMNTHFMSQYSTGASVLHRSPTPVTRDGQPTKPGGRRTTETTRLPPGSDRSHREFRARGPPAQRSPPGSPPAAIDPTGNPGPGRTPTGPASRESMDGSTAHTEG